NGQGALFDMVADPGQTKNIASQKTEVAARMTKALSDWRASITGVRAAPAPAEAAATGKGGKGKGKGGGGRCSRRMIVRILWATGNFRGRRCRRATACRTVR
ncbi:MAG: hypothetical protein HC814_05360, partial [Rhodobacteraceae bacterium]|nr:hypothetical protein [Paracoccaceae bacterium]